LKSSGAIGKGVRKRKSCYDNTSQVDFWLNKLDERRWRSRKKMTTDEIQNIDLGFDAPPPSYVAGLELRELRKKRIRAAKYRIDKVRMGFDTSEEVNLIRESVVEKRGRR